MIKSNKYIKNLQWTKILEKSEHEYQVVLEPEKPEKVLTDNNWFNIYSVSFFENMLHQWFLRFESTQINQTGKVVIMWSRCHLLLPDW